MRKYPLILHRYIAEQDSEEVMTSYYNIRFISDRYPPRKTKIFVVVNKESKTVLGMITWHGPFRKYSFFPEPNRVFETTCMKDIAGFMDNLMEEWKFGKAKEFIKPKIDKIIAEVKTEMSDTILREGYGIRETHEEWDDPHKMVKVSDDPANFERREI